MRLFYLALPAALALVIACTGGGDGGGDGGATSSTSGSSGAGTSGTGTTTSSGGTSGGTTASSSGSTSGGSTEVTDTGFAKECSVDDDCIPAYFGNTCRVCTNSNASIAKSSQAAYQKAYNDAHAKCPSGGPVGDCEVARIITRCNGDKKCEFASCGKGVPADAHHCAEGGL